MFRPSRKNTKSQIELTRQYRDRPKGVYVSLVAMLRSEGELAPMAYINGCKRKEWFLTDYNDITIDIIHEYCSIMSQIYPQIDQFLHVREEKGETGDVLRVTCLVDLNPDSEVNNKETAREKRKRRIEFKNPVLREADKRFQQKDTLLLGRK